MVKRLKGMGPFHRAETPIFLDKNLSFRRRMYALLLDSSVYGNYQIRIDRTIGILIVLNLFALLAEHIPAIYDTNVALFHGFDVFSVIVFTIEYVIRVYLAPERKAYHGSKWSRFHYVISPLAVIDLLAIAPFYLQAFFALDLRMLRALRLLRILKLFRMIVPAYREFRALNAHRSFRQQVYALVYPSEYGGRLRGMFDNFIVFWVAVSVTAVILESVESIHNLLNHEFIILDTVVVCIFTIEYCMRIYSCVESPGFRGAILGRLKQAKTFASVIDLLSILPWILEKLFHHVIDLQFLRVLRMLRLFKLNRYTDATATLVKVIVRERQILSAAAFIMLLLVVLTACLGYLFEHDTQPDKFSNIPQAIYWGVITLTSVGYGDISPLTPAGRFVTIILSLMGIGIFAIPAAILTSSFNDQLRQDREALKEELYTMLNDGVYTMEESDVINRQAHRLHLTDAEIERMVERAQQEREAQDIYAALPLHKIAEKPEHAIEHYKSLLSQIRQLGLMTDPLEFERLAVDHDRLSASELALWRIIHDKKTS